jgi:hypothetical protein
VQIYSAEHLVRAYQSWSCAAAPVHDPDTGTQIGAIDVSGLLQDLHPAVVSLVTATAELAESHLRMQMAVRDEQLRARNMPHLAGLAGEAGALVTPTGRVLAAEPAEAWPERVDVRAGVETVLLGDGREAQLEPLSEGYLLRVPRFGRAELLTLLALAPAGLTAEQLALALYGEDGNPVTVRAEIHRLRTQLGELAMRTKPYRLRAEVEADFLTVRAALRDGDLRAALAAGRAPLLARSEAPAIRAERDELVTALRHAVLDRGDVDALWEYSQREPGRDDLAVFERLAAELPSQDPRQPVSATRKAALLTE